MPANVVANPVVEVYWLPGCSSCLRLKEFMTRSGVEYESINVVEQPERADRLQDLGLYTPAVCVGDDCVSGTGLDVVARLVGIPYGRPPLLSPAALKSRFDRVLDAACRFIEQLPPGGLEHRLAGRERPMLDVANQTVSVMRAFLAADRDGTHDRQFTKCPPDVRTAADLLARGDETRRLVQEWWESGGAGDPLARVIDTPWWGRRQLHEVFEREVWHTVQHTRQLMLALYELGVEPDDPLTEEDFAGLYLPDAVQA